MGCWTLDAVPSETFTPQEHLVELIRVILSRDSLLLLLEPKEKTFLILMLIREFDSRNANSGILLILGDEDQIEPWNQFLDRMTNFQPRSNLVLISSNKLKDIDFDSDIQFGKNWNLILLDNAQNYLKDSNLKSQLDILRKSSSNPRFAGFTSNLLNWGSKKMGLKGLKKKLNQVSTFYDCCPETSCEIMTFLRFVTKPQEKVLNVSLSSSPEDIELEIEKILHNLENFLENHQFSLTEIYGEEFEDLIADIPDPSELPLRLIQNFLSIIRNCGVWCAERAALLLTIKIEKLKKREKYERHYLLLSLLYSEMMKISKICDDAFADMSEKEKLIKFSKPKLTKLMDILLTYKPLHIIDPDAAPQVIDEKKEGGGEMTNETQPRSAHPKKSRKSGYSSYDDPNSLWGVIFVKDKFMSKVLYHYLKHYSRSDNKFSFLFPNYAVQTSVNEPDKNKTATTEDLDEDNSNRKQEESLRRFRMRECNILVSNSLLEVGIDCVRCNLIVAFDLPESFQTYAHYKVKAKAAKSYFVSLVCENELNEWKSKVKSFHAIENLLIQHCTFKDSPLKDRLIADYNNDLIEPYNPLNKENDSSKISSHKDLAKPLNEAPKLTLKNATLLLNRYCAKLPSDTFTRLTPLNSILEVDNDYVCIVQLPINSPYKKVIVGPKMPSQVLAKRAAAFKACKKLHEIYELDNNMNPIGKHLTASYTSNHNIINNNINSDNPRPGTTKRRQYYYKKIAVCLKSDQKNKKSSIQENKELVNEPEGNENEEKIVKKKNYKLYDINLHLSCPIPDDQNTRGRKIYPPEISNQSFGILALGSIPPICPFPIYTRSGEVLTQVVLIENEVEISEEQMELILNFHNYTFSQVLRLEKYPMMFSPFKSENSILIIPLKKKAELLKTIDWDFLQVIKLESTRKLTKIPDEDRKNFKFDESIYTDAVIMPWYRNTDQPQYFYVAEICNHLNPQSDFPGEGFESFSKYYASKYEIKIQSLDQPLLDVDHTSHRLNFLTPRYVNRKGVALPTSSEETKRNKRENLEQKQILVPELCAIHPFPASLWRQTVCLPCILYRLNGLLIADDLRSLVASEYGLGIESLSQDFKWPALDFGWTLSDVLKNRDNQPLINNNSEEKRKKKNTLLHNSSSSTTAVLKDDEIQNDIQNEGVTSSSSPAKDLKNKETNKNELTSLSDQLINKMNEEESKLKKKQLEIGTWSNEMAANDERRKKIKDKILLDDEEFDQDDLDLLDPNMALPDNLTLLSNDILPTSNYNGVKPQRDWGTGIEQKHFRVGSPTFFSNPNINIPGMMDDLDGFSCSDSSDYGDYDDDDYTFVEDDDDMDKKSITSSKSKAKALTMTEESTTKGVRIEFRGNLAEAIEDEAEINLRVESMERDLEEESRMVRELPWNIENSDDDTDDYENDDNYCDIDVVSTFSRTDLLSNNAVSDEDKVTGFKVSELKVDESMQKIFQKHLNIDPDKVIVCTPSDRPILGVVPWEDDDVLPFSFDAQPDLKNHPGPSPSLILQALTMSNSNDAINLERLETIGDSFLKYAITSYLFNTHESVHEGRLSHLRSKQVSNLNLYKLGRFKRLGERMIATKFEPHDNWLPPCYHVPLELEQALIESEVPASDWNTTKLPLDENTLQNMTSEDICNLIKEKSEKMTGKPISNQDLPSFIPYNLLTQHSIPDKSIADCVEALIGAYLISSGQRGALLFMSWLGLQVLPATAENDEDNKNLTPVELHNKTEIKLPPSPLLRNSINPELELEYFLRSGYDEFEDLIGYKFKDRSYLLQAFSHASYYPNRLTDCYQRLEFLGDAILDYLITRHLYEDPRQHSPGALTDLRSALVNNTIFASLAVKYQFHKYFKHFSPGLEVVVDRFVKIQVRNGFKVFDEFYLVDEDDSSEEAEDIEVPKALGDIFESVAGAIFLDSGLSLDSVWRIYYRMMKSEINTFSSNVPKSPIRELLELEPETAKFGKPEKLADGKRVRVGVEVFGKGVFKGIGRNYRIAKCTAARCALKALKKSSSNVNRSNN